ncbi:hypothetical protein WG906_08780 [Pedobacter sp. P351]|uniref:hypothetical protein n=1 Tax=Pedobacter superstes TaxID=3133441 RepID=UPI0030B1346B
MIRALILFILFPLCVSSQDLTKLDERNGFNKFQLGSSVKDNKTITKLKHVSSSNKTNEEIYEVKNLQDFKLFGYLVDHIRLHFYKDQLWQIDVKLPDAVAFSQQFIIAMHINDGILKEYGLYSRRSNSLQSKHINKRQEFYWEGASVTLTRFSSLHPNIDGDRWIFLSNSIGNERAAELGLYNTGL